MKYQVEKDPVARKDYLERLNTIRKGKIIRIKHINKRYQVIECDMIHGKNGKKLNQKDAVDYLKNL